MKRLCAWCGRALDETQHLPSDELTHGICAECSFKCFGPDDGNKSGDVPSLPDAAECNVAQEKS